MKVLNWNFKIEKDARDRTRDEILESNTDDQINWITNRYLLLFVAETPDRWTHDNMTEYPVEIYFPNTLISKFRDMERFFREFGPADSNIQIHRTVLTAVLTA